VHQGDRNLRQLLPAAQWYFADNISMSCCGSEAAFSLYQSARLSRYDIVS
jgi:hypothetical protein